jgi:hypothetical protein
MKLHMFRTVPLFIIGSFSLYTQQWYMSNRFTDSLRAGSKWNCVSFWSCSLAVSKPVWHTPLLCVQWKTPGDGQRNCPKHVEFHSKNKFEKLMHLVGFILRNLSRCTVTWTSNRTDVFCPPHVILIPWILTPISQWNFLAFRYKC